MTSFVPSQRQRGSPKLVFEFYSYSKCANYGKTNGRRKWVCEQRGSSNKCPGRAITDAENDVKVTHSHNHPRPIGLMLEALLADQQVCSTFFCYCLLPELVGMGHIWE